MYDQGRYFTVTGHHFRFSPVNIENRQDELEALHANIFGEKKEAPRSGYTTKSPEHDLSDAELIEKAHRAANGEKFGKLWRGDWQGAGYLTQSEADLALCDMLAFWAQGDPSAIDRLFRQSGLFRKKWDERHYADGRTYGEETIRKAIAAAAEFYQGTSAESDQEVSRGEGESREDRGPHHEEDAYHNHEPEDDKAGASVKEEPTPWIAPPPSGWPDPLRPEAMHGLAGEFVRLVEPHTEADPVALLVQFLTAFGNVIGPGASYQVENDIHHTKLFTCQVGETSKARKGTSYGRVRNIFHGADPEWAETRIMSGFVSGEGLIWQVRDPITRLEPVKEKGRLTGEYHEVIIDPGVRDKRLLIFEPEFASTLKVMNRDGNILSAAVRQAWDGPNLSTLAKNSPGRTTGAHISIIAHITKEELCRYLDRTEAANGFGNRFLWVCVRRSKLLPEGGQLQDVDFAPLLKKLSAAINFGREAGRIRLSEDARQIWREVYGPLSEGKPGMFGALVSRAEAQVVRLACIYTLLDYSLMIHPEHLYAALAVWHYAEASVRYIFGDATGDPVADQILAALREAPGGLSQTDISNLFGRNLPAGRIHQALTLLLNQRMVVAETKETGGRRAVIWKAVTKKTN